MSKMQKIIDRYAILLNIFNVIACIWIMVITVMIMVDVIGRLVFLHPISGTPEFVQGSIVVIAFMMSGFVQYQRKHLSVTVFYSKMNPQTQKVADLIADAFGVLAMIVILVGMWASLQLSMNTHEFDGDGRIVRIPTVLWKMPVVICTITNIVLYAMQFIHRLITPASISTAPAVEEDEELGGMV